MSKIRLMSPELANQIAAGEVIERPSSVIKELVENSIDAHAKTIEVSILRGGKDLISVKDDGEGMDREDAKMAFLRHASSKLHSEYDLMRITTLGFRGEAVPSIASVSKVRMVTSTGEGVGSEVESVPGKDLMIKDAPLRKGTTFEVKELFFNTPARLKYLKSDRTENYSCIEVVEHLALGFPNIAFRMINDGKEVFRTTGRGNLLETISIIFGNQIAKSCLPFKLEGDGYSGEGYICHPSVNYSTRYDILTFLNSRSVYIPKVQRAIINGYKDYIPPERYPLAVIAFTVDYSLVDVNVHPSKKEVRLSCEEALANDVYQMTRKVLATTRDTFASPEITDRDVMRFVPQTGPSEVREETPAPTNPPVRPELNPSDFNSVPFAPVEPQKTEEGTEEHYGSAQLESLFAHEEEEAGKAAFRVEDSQGYIDYSSFDRKPVVPPKENSTFPTLFPIGQVLMTYIVCDAADGMYLIDQHAAAERINFEMCQRQFEGEKTFVAPLFPIVLNLSHSLMSNFDEAHQKALKQLGITVNAFGPDSVKVDEIPDFLSHKSDDAVLRDIVTQILTDSKVDVTEIERKAIATKACHMSIKAHRILTHQEQVDLIRTLAGCRNPLNCPHGRPTVIRISQYDIEKLFKRTGFGS